jgi:hypothetical protein
MFDITKEADPQFGRRDYPNGYRVLPTLVGSGWATDNAKIHVDRDGKVIDDNAVHAFTRGQCHAFALACHKLTGFEIKGLWAHGREYGSPGHVVVEAPDKRLLDITGHPVKYMKTIGFHVGKVDSVPVEEVPHLQYYAKPNVGVALPFARTLLEREGYGAYIRG